MGGLCDALLEYQLLSFERLDNRFRIPSYELRPIHEGFRVQHLSCKSLNGDEGLLQMTKKKLKRT
jgi:hypothetical protein